MYVESQSLDQYLVNKKSLLLLLLLLFSNVLESSIGNSTLFPSVPFLPLIFENFCCNFCSRLIFMCFWTNISPPWRANYRSTITFDPAVISLLPRPSSPAIFVFMAYYLNFWFIWVQSNDLKYRSRLPRGKLVTLAPPLATRPW